MALIKRVLTIIKTGPELEEPSTATLVLKAKPEEISALVARLEKQGEGPDTFDVTVVETDPAEALDDIETAFDEVCEQLDLPGTDKEEDDDEVEQGDGELKVLDYDESRDGEEWEGFRRFDGGRVLNDKGYDQDGNRVEYWD
jgi:hypothetical protein